MEDKRICDGCGASLDKDEVKCLYCGKVFSNSTIANKIEEQQSIVEEKNNNVKINKSCNGKKQVIIGIIISTLIIIGGIATWFIIDGKEDENKKLIEPEAENKNNEEKNGEKSENEIVYFYKDNDEVKLSNRYDDIENKNSIIKKYNCALKYCSAASTQDFDLGILNNKKSLIYEYGEYNDGEKREDRIILFDIDREKVIGKYGASIVALKERCNSACGFNYILVSDINEGLYGIFDKDGNMIHNFNLSFPKNKRFKNSWYFVEGDYIADYKNDKFGIVRINSNEVIVDYKYDDVVILDSKYYKVKDNDKWYLFSFDTKNKVLNDGYDFIFGVYNNIVVVDSDKKIYIKDLSSNDLIEKPIEDTSESIIEIMDLCCGGNPGVWVKYEENVITITIYKDNVTDDPEVYKFDLVNNKLY